MRIDTAFPGREALNQTVEVRMAEGMAAAVGQLDALLARTPQPSAD